uniref:Uncharacterized protein n=1 Tax=Anguilla anguilla TaxID=7936 RepID=A0A0E9Q086_ANGAN
MNCRVSERYKRNQNPITKFTFYIPFSAELWILPLNQL